MIIAGVRYVTASDVYAEFPDVTPARLRDWRRRRLLVPVSRAELAAALGVDTPPDPHGPARMLVTATHRYEVLMRWDSVVEAEMATGTATAGRRRRFAA